MRKPVFCLTAVFLLLFTSAGRRPVTIFIIGDSTAAQKDTSSGSPERGWGMMLQEEFDRHVRVANHAVNGRSSKSFIDEGRWQRVLEQLRPGDYVIIQFGHNDEKSDTARHTNPGTTFDNNLRHFISDTRSRRATPILMNSVVRRNWVGDTVLVDTHGEYIQAPRRVARQTNAIFIDANRITHDLEQSLGPEGSRGLHMCYQPGEHPALPEGRQDNTHYNIQGARTVAVLLADAIAQKVPKLRRHHCH